MKPTPLVWPEPPRFFRTFDLSTAADVDFLAVSSASVDMSGCPEDTCPGRLIIHNTTDTAVDLVLTGEDGVNFTLTIPGGPTATAGHTEIFEGGVSAVEATGSGNGLLVTACWWAGNRMPRRSIA